MPICFVKNCRFHLETGPSFLHPCDAAEVTYLSVSASGGESKELNFVSQFFISLRVEGLLKSKQ